MSARSNPLFRSDEHHNSWRRIGSRGSRRWSVLLPTE